MKSIAELANVYQGLSRVGHGAGARRGQWMLRIVESSDVHDDGWLDMNGLRKVGLVHSIHTEERHLLRPFDLLVTSRTGFVQIALVPPDVSRTVAGVTLLVVQVTQPESGMAHWLWYYLTSSIGRTKLVKCMTASVTLKSLIRCQPGT